MRTIPTAANFPRLLLALLTVLAFANALANGFVWIDHWQVESSGLIAHSWPQLWATVRQPLGSMPGWEGSAPYARPTVVALFSLVDALAGPNPAVYHGTLVLLHLANVLLAYDLLCVLAVAPGVAWMACAIFAVHPLQTAAVTWVSGIADPLFTFGLLLAFRCEFAPPAARRSRRLIRAAACGAFAIALGAKETALVFPLLLAVTWAIVPDTLRRPSAAHVTARIAPYLLIAAAALLYRVAVLQTEAAGTGFGATPLFTRLGTVPHLLLSYLTLPLRFAALTVCDDYQLSAGWQDWALPAAGVAGICGTAFAYRRRLPHVTLGIAWMLLALGPVLNIVPILHYRADRFFYFPLLGWALAATSIGDTVLRPLAVRRPVVLRFLCACTALCLGTLTMRRNTLFRDDLTLFEATVRTSPACREAHTALGDIYLRGGRAADAVEQYERALVPHPNLASYVVGPKVLINLGMAQLERRDYSAALAAFTKAHQLQPRLLHPLFGLGVANLALDRAPEAVTWLEQAQAQDGDNPDIIFNLALAYERLGRMADAHRLYEHYLDVAPRGQARSQAQARLRRLEAAGF